MPGHARHGVLHQFPHQRAATRNRARLVHGVRRNAGLMLSTVFLAYTGASITRVFFISAASFGALSLYGYTTQRSLSAMGSFLMMGLVGLLIAMVVNIFLKSTGWTSSSPSSAC